MSADTQPSKYKSPFADFPPMEFAPLDVPLFRRRQTFAIAIYTFQGWLFAGLFIFICTIPKFWPLIILYLIYIYFDNTAEQGGKRWDWLCNLTLWKWAAEFFPVRLVREKELDPSKNFIFGYHPHGVLSTGAFFSFATEAAGLSEKFPGLNIRLLTLMLNFYLPFYRELILRLNCASVSRQSILNILQSGPGNSVAIVIGGAQESLNAKPELCDLVLSKRYGFVKLAIQTGSSLVPVFAFGENSIYDQFVPESGSFLNQVQSKIKGIFGFTIPFVLGRGIFTYNYGIMPKRHPITVVVGAPIEVPKDENPSQEKFQGFHQKYMEALKDLYNRNKDKYSIGVTPPPMKFV